MDGGGPPILPTDDAGPPPTARSWVGRPGGPGTLGAGADDDRDDDSADRDSADRDGADRDGADRDGADRDGADRDGADRDDGRSLGPGRYALVVTAVLGAVTAAAQGWLPQQLAPLANSAGAWTLVTAVGVCWSRARPLPGAALGAGCFLALDVGYAVLSASRGLSYPIDLQNRWVVVGFVAGPLVGLGASWSGHRRDALAALGVAALAGVLVGEAWYGLTVLDPSPSALYWTISAVGGSAVLAWGVLTRLDGVPARVLAVAATAVVTIGIPAVLAVVGGVHWTH